MLRPLAFLSLGLIIMACSGSEEGIEDLVNSATEENWESTEKADSISPAKIDPIKKGFQVVYLNFGDETPGGTKITYIDKTGDKDNAPQYISQLPSLKDKKEAIIPPFNPNYFTSPGDLREECQTAPQPMICDITKEVETAYNFLNSPQKRIVFVNKQVAAAQYAHFTMAVIGGKPADVYRDNCNGVSAETDCHNKNPDNIVFIFIEQRSKNLKRPAYSVARTIIHELGHSFGLEHTTTKTDFMLGLPRTGAEETARQWENGPTMGADNRGCGIGAWQYAEELLQAHLDPDTPKIKLLNSSNNNSCQLILIGKPKSKVNMYNNSSQMEIDPLTIKSDGQVSKTLSDCRAGDGLIFWTEENGESSNKVLRFVKGIDNSPPLAPSNIDLQPDNDEVTISGTAQIGSMIYIENVSTRESIEVNALWDGGLDGIFTAKIKGHSGDNLVIYATEKKYATDKSKPYTDESKNFSSINQITIP